MNKNDTLNKFLKQYYKLISDRCFLEDNPYITIKDGKNIKKLEKLGLTKFEIPMGIMHIDAGAFYNCKNLKTIIIPSSIEDIGEDAFYGCASLEKLVFQDIDMDEIREMDNYPWGINNPEEVITIEDSSGSVKESSMTKKELLKVMKDKNSNVVFDNEDIRKLGGIGGILFRGVLTGDYTKVNWNGDIVKPFHLEAAVNELTHLPKEKERAKIAIERIMRRYMNHLPEEVKEEVKHRLYYLAGLDDYYVYGESLMNKWVKRYVQSMT